MPGNALSQQELARLLGLTPRQIQNLVKAGMPQEAEGRHPRYPVPAAIQWYVQQKEQFAREETKKKFGPRDRTETLRADLLEIELAEKLDQVMTIEQFRTARFDADARVAAKLKALENRLAPAVVGTVDVQDGLKRVKPLVAEVMDELYRAEDVSDPADKPEEPAA